LLKTIKARYRNGIIEPLEEIDLADGAEVTITLEDVSPPMSEEERLKRFLSSAGGWKDIVDEKFLDEIYRQRSLRTRPEVKL
jgi:predicted DNA-binding antitoxin AbrB/MazE fold protein